MRNKVVKVLCIIIIGFTVNSYGQSNDRYKNTSLSIKLTDKELASHGVIIRTFQNYIFGNIGSSEYNIEANKDGVFNWSSNLKTLIYFTVELENFGLVQFYLNPGDNIEILYTGSGKSGKIKNEELKIVGRGSEKFQVMKALNSADYPVKTNITSNANPLEVIDSSFKTSGLIYEQRTKILNSFKARISRSMFEILNAENYGFSYFGFYNFLALRFKSLKINRKDSIALIFKFKKENFKSTDFSLNSPSFLLYLYYKSRALTVMSHNTARIDIKDLYNEIVASNSGNRREKMLVYLLVKGGYGSTNNDKIPLFDKSLMYIKNDQYRSIILQLKKSMTIGTPAYPFILPDTSGKLISLSEFKGKTIVVDCWFTGCASCIRLAKTIDTYVLPVFKDNPDVIYISVCVDKSKEQWISSLQTGDYTNKKSINLFTEGKGLNHPFIKNYLFDSFPQIMLIDKSGNIFSPILPRFPNEMIEVIKNALSIDARMTQNK